MKASVLIPALNEEKYIDQALERLSKQTFKDFETIVIDNGSIDGTALVASRFPVCVLREDRRGTMWACEAGRRAAKGEIIVRLDADCLPEPDWLERGVRHFEDRRVVAVSGSFDVYDYTRFLSWSSIFVSKYFYPAVNSLLQAFHLGAILLGGNSFMRASSLDQAGGFDTRFVFYGDDADVAKRISKLGKVAYDPRLTMRTSARRYKKEGIIHTQLAYFKNFYDIVSK